MQPASLHRRSILTCKEGSKHLRSKSPFNYAFVWTAGEFFHCETSNMCRWPPTLAGGSPLTNSTVYCSSICCGSGQMKPSAFLTFCWSASQLIPAPSKPTTFLTVLPFAKSLHITVLVAADCFTLVKSALAAQQHSTEVLCGFLPPNILNDNAAPALQSSK